MSHLTHPGPAQPDKPEEEVWRGGPSLRLPGLHLGLAFLLVVAVEIVAWMIAGSAGLVARIVLYVVLLLVVGVRGLLAQWSESYRLSNKYLYVERGILNKVVDQVDMRRFRDLRVRKMFLSRIVGCGDVVVISTDVTNSEQVLRDVAKPDGVAAMIRQVAESRRTSIVDVE